MNQSGPAVSLSLEGGPPIQIFQPRPLLVSERSCEAVAGLQKRAFLKVARAMQCAGFKVTPTSDGVAVLVADLEAYVREHAPEYVSEVKGKGEPVVDETEAEYLRAVGHR